MNLYLVQDSDRPIYIVARDYGHAVQRWRRVIFLENYDPEADSLDDVEEPEGAQLVAKGHELLLPGKELPPWPGEDDR